MLGSCTNKIYIDCITNINLFRDECLHLNSVYVNGVLSIITDGSKELKFRCSHKYVDGVLYLGDPIVEGDVITLEMVNIQKQLEKLNLEFVPKTSDTACIFKDFTLIPSHRSNTLQDVFNKLKTTIGELK